MLNQKALAKQFSEEITPHKKPSHGLGRQDSQNEQNLPNNKAKQRSRIMNDSN